MTTRTKLLGIGFLCAWFIGAIFVEKLGLPTPIYATFVVSLEIATIISVFINLAGNSVNSY